MVDFDVQLLAVLRELAERGSVTAVAEATHRTPSAVSQQLRTLQRQAGVPLVERRAAASASPRRTAGARRARRRVATASPRWTRPGASTWADRRPGRPRDLPVGGRAPAPRPPHPDAGAPGHRARARRRRRQRGRVRPLAADHDVVVGHRPDGAPPAGRAGLRTFPLLREPLDVAFPTEHPLAGRRRVGIDDVVGETWIGVPESYPIDRVLTALAAATDTPPSVAFRTIHLPLIENLVAAGHGIALVPRYTSGTRAPGRFPPRRARGRPGRTPHRRAGPPGPCGPSRGADRPGGVGRRGARRHQPDGVTVAAGPTRASRPARERMTADGRRSVRRGASDVRWSTSSSASPV